jgi:hypothetical protein
MDGGAKRQDFQQPKAKHGNGEALSRAFLY